MTPDSVHEPEHEPGPASGPRPAERIVPSSTPVLQKVLRYGALLALAIAVLGAVAGGLAVGWIGVWSAFIGTAMALVFLGITAASILIANRFIASELFVGIFFAMVLGSWVVKFIVFIVLAIVLRGQPWISPVVMFLCLIVAVVGSLVVDVVVILRSRVPYVSDLNRPDRRPGA